MIFFLLTFINFPYHVVVLYSYRDLSLQPLELDLKGFESMNLIFFPIKSNCIYLLKKRRRKNNEKRNANEV